MSVTMRAGDWLAVTTETRWALVDLPEGDARESEVIDAIRSSDLSAVLEILVKEGMKGTPAFAMVGIEADQLRLLVRGGGTVALTGPEATLTHSGHASPTWLDAYVGPGRYDYARICAPEAGSAIAASAVGRAGEVTATLSSAASSSEIAPPVVDAAAHGTSIPDAVAHPEPPPLAATGASYESVFFDLLTENTTTRDALARSLAEAQAAGAEAVDVPITPIAPAEPALHALPGDGHTATWEGTSSWYRPADPAPATAPVPAPPQPGPGGIIDVLPWIGTPSPPIPPPVAVPGPAVAEPPPPPPPPPPYVPAELARPDMTRTRGDLAAALSEPLPSGPQVLAVVCPNRHWSTPYASTCRVCSAPVSEQQPQRIPRPVLGRLSMSTGAVVTLDRGVVFGRAPQSPDSGADRPHLVKLESKEISRNHAAIRIADWQVMIRDLGSGNGTTITLPGRPAEVIRPHEEYTVEPGAIIGIADLVTITYDVG